MNEPKVTGTARYLTASGSIYLFHVVDHRLERVNSKPLRLPSGATTDRTTWTVNNYGMAASSVLVGSFSMMFLVEEEDEPVITTAIVRMEYV